MFHVLFPTPGAHTINHTGKKSRVDAGARWMHSTAARLATEITPTLTGVAGV